MAKLIVHGTDREEAIAKALSALAEFRIEGVATNIGFLRELLAHPQFQAGELSTDFIEKHMS